MSATAPAPAVTTAPGSAAPASAAIDGPDAAAAPAPISGELLRARIIADLTGQTPAPQDPAAPESPNGPLPETDAATPTDSADGVQTQSPPNDSPDNADSDPEDANLPGAVRNVLRELRADRRLLREQLADATAQLRDLRTNKPESDQNQEPTPQERVGRLTNGLNWAKRTLNMLRRGDTDGALAEVRRMEANPPATDADGLTEWLEGVREAYQEQLTSARIEQQVEQRMQQGSEAALRQQTQNHALTLMPELAQPESARAKMAAQLRALHPSLERDPRGDIMVMTLIRGLEALQAEAKATGATAAPAAVTANGKAANGSNGNGVKVVLPARTGARLPGSSRPAPQVTEMDASALYKRFQETGSETDKAAWKASLVRGIGGRAGEVNSR